MYWIVESNLFNEPFYDKLLPFLDRMNIPYEINRVVPFSGEFLEEPQPTQEHIIVIGSYSMTEEAIRRGWVPGAFTNENYDYRVWSRKWEGRCLNQPAVVSKFSEVPYQEGDFFIRPCGDEKCFTGHVKNWEEFTEWQRKVLDLGQTYSTLNGDTMVLTCEPKRIEAEYRFIVVDGRVITGSLYKQGDTALYQECTDPGIISTAQEIVHMWRDNPQIAAPSGPSRAFALDLALHAGELWVLEMGNMNAAGLYDCDVQKIVIALESMTFSKQERRQL